uniref:WGS project CBME000000000 data, contig CS3487_c000333 n=1 Tax=Fusarium pseudograminearum CS3487 TaxID=1318458 RepID=A0A096PDA1_FUSPS|nr:unnamed protein product [Fusarium pseudograminearum CS3487]
MPQRPQAHALCHTSSSTLRLHPARHLARPPRRMFRTPLQPRNSSTGLFKKRETDMAHGGIRDECTTFVSDASK